MHERKELFRFLKFVGFSVSAGAIQLLSFALLSELIDLSDWLSYLIALILSVIWNFTFNRKFTFKSAKNVPLAMLQTLAFYAVFTPVTTLGEKYLTETLLWNGYIVTIMNMLLNFVLEFLYQRYVVFRKSIDTNIKEK